MDDDALWRVQNNRRRLRDRMRHRDEHEPEWPMIYPLATGDRSKIRLDAQLVDTHTRHLHRQPGPVHRDLDVPEEVGKGPHVILMTVGDYHAFHVLLPLGQPGPVRKHQVDTQHVVFGKHETHIDECDLAFDLDGGTVAADLPETAQECD